MISASKIAISLLSAKSIACRRRASRRRTFLDEVQYLAGLWIGCNCSTIGSPPRLAKPSRGIRGSKGRAPFYPAGPEESKVRLSYRRPVLAVAAPNRPRPVAVDGKAIVLPANAATKKLPLFKASTPPDGRGRDDLRQPRCRSGRRKASEAR